MSLDYYRILGTREDVSEDELKKAYRRIAKKYHPDANPEDQEAEKKFKEAVEAYGILGDAEKRRIYDQERTNRKEQYITGEKKTKKNKKDFRQGANFDYCNTSSNFEQFFGFRPEDSQMNEDQLNPSRKTKTNPIDMTAMFERYMGIKK